ncbi:MAG: ribosome recycling factor [Candidatus Atribacteria bacterium]|nr:ribosome recycling factor [Candidatus Atribacteria bacterium]
MSDGELKKLLKDTEKRMQQAVQVLREEFSHVKTGRASPALIENLEIDYYGSSTELKQIASISTPDARTLLIQPWDKNALQAIEKAIWKSDLGFNPVIDSAVIRISVPPLTEERRKEIAKTVKKLAEEAKVAIRNIRREANEEIKKMEKESLISEDESKRNLGEVQKLTDDFINQIEGLWEKKEKEIMSV